MIFTSALCLVLALASSTSGNQASVDQLLNKVTGAVVAELIQVANAARAAGDDPVAINTKVLSALSSVLTKFEAEILEVSRLSSGLTPQDIAKAVAQSISQNEALQKALPGGDSTVKPRFIGAAIIGVAQIATDVVNMLLRRY